MKLLKFSGLLLITLLFFSCETLTDETGIKGTVYYGEGSCFPSIDEETREYDAYSGKLYFIDKAEMDEIGTGMYEAIDQLKASSTSRNISKGELDEELDPGEYVLLTENFYDYTDAHVITITDGDVLKQDLKFWLCTSY